MKYIFYILAFTTVFASCTKKTEDIFDKSADQRLSEVLTKHKNNLVNAPGWKFFVYPKGLESQDIFVGGFTYYVKFTANNRVSMVSDFLTSLAATPKESGYRVVAFQRPSLVFDTYTYMHIPADPDPNVSFSPMGTGGYGFGTDFNFSFKDVTPKDTMYLQGNFNKSEAVLIKATQAEMDAAFVNGRLSHIMNSSFPYPFNNPFLYLPAGSNLNVGVGFDFNNTLITFTYISGGAFINTTFPFSFTTYGIHLGKPITIGNYTFQDLYWDDVKKLYYIQSGPIRVEFANSSTPLIVLPLTNIIGKDNTTITIPPGAGLPNQSPLFMTRYNAARTGIANLLTGSIALTLDDIDFVFNAAAKTMNVNVYIIQQGQFYLAQYNYIYTVDGAGNFKFTRTSQNGNATFINTPMNNILSFIDADQFKIDGIASSFGFLGTMKSQQTPTFYFTGVLY